MTAMTREQNTDLDTTIANLTAFRSLAHLKQHHTETGWAPSFRTKNIDGVELAARLVTHGILCRFYT